MIDSVKLLSLPVLLTLSLAAGSVTAAGPEKRVSKDQIYAGARNQVVLDGQQFKNVAQEDQLRHQVRENEGKGEKNRHQHQTKQGKQSKNQHQYQYKNQSGSQHMQQSQSGSMSRGGKGGGGGRH